MGGQGVLVPSCQEGMSRQHRLLRARWRLCTEKAMKDLENSWSRGPGSGNQIGHLLFIFFCLQPIVSIPVDCEAIHFPKQCWCPLLLCRSTVMLPLPWAQWAWGWESGRQVGCTSVHMHSWVGRKDFIFSAAWTVVPVH
jgi:hypothetical protein